MPRPEEFQRAEQGLSRWGQAVRPLLLRLYQAQRATFRAQYPAAPCDAPPEYPAATPTTPATPLRDLKRFLYTARDNTAPRTGSPTAPPADFQALTEAVEAAEHRRDTQQAPQGHRMPALLTLTGGAA